MLKEISQISQYIFEDELLFIKKYINDIHFDFRTNDSIKKRSECLINKITNSNNFSVEKFLQEYSLSLEEGVAVMCLSESLIRIPDSDVAFELSLDKLSDKSWAGHLSSSKTTFIRLASLGLFVAGTWSNLCSYDNLVANAMSRIGKPMFLSAIRSVIRWLGHEFVLGEDIEQGIKKAYKFQGYKFSFDLLGESSRTFKQAEEYYNRYLEAIDVIAKSPLSDSSLSVKLTALYPRLELTKIEDAENYLLPRLIALVKKMHEHNIAITFDAEEYYRLQAYLHIVTKLISHEEFKDFNKIGIVVQAYHKSALSIVEYIISLSKSLNKSIPIRLVKGAYWDSEIKYAQTLGLEAYPVFTRKDLTDANYLIVAKKILDNTDYITPQFATHNAITASSIIEMAGDKQFEFQKLHGMGLPLHSELVKNHNVRIYAPIGKMEDLLAYLMRRLLENGANTSFVHQIEQENNNMVYNIYDKVMNLSDKTSIVLPLDIYSDRKNSMGYELGIKSMQEELINDINKFSDKIYRCSSIINGNEILSKRATDHFRPAKTSEKIGDISIATEENMKEAIDYALEGFKDWTNKPVSERSTVLRNIADLFEKHKDELFSLLIKEAGKSISDAILELREAVDFCRYYANEAERIMQDKIMPGITGERNILSMHGRGVFLCISPWNFPLAIFTGQIVAALVSGNSVISKPADQTSIIANFAIKLMHKAGVPKNALHLLVAPGSVIGKYVVSDKSIAGVAFTGSTATAKVINSTLATRDGAIVPIIAETGGQNAMIVDSSSLLEQVTDDVLTSAFYSAGQRCSALRILYVQEEIYDALLELITGAIATLKIGDTTDFAHDIGPVIDKTSFDILSNHITNMESKGFKTVATHPQNWHLKDGYYFYPHVIEVNGINDIESEKFGPILHIAKYKHKDLDKVIDEINNYGFGLTFGIHSRIESKIEYIRSKIKAGNIYVNRSTTGAIVESQPFGGENKSGTGFKAGGPHYLLRFMLERTTSVNLTAIGGNIDLIK